jgi:hypothetical protein
MTKWLSCLVTNWSWILYISLNIFNVMKNYRRFTCVFNCTEDGENASCFVCSFFGCILNQNRLIIHIVIAINSELAVLPEKLCIVWTAILMISSKESFTIRWTIVTDSLILLAGDVATSPGPTNYLMNSASSKQVKCLVLNTRSIKSIHRDPASNVTVCNFQRFQDLVYNENSDITVYVSVKLGLQRILVTKKYCFLGS